MDWKWNGWCCRCRHVYILAGKEVRCVVAAEATGGELCGPEGVSSMAAGGKES